MPRCPFCGFTWPATGEVVGDATLSEPVTTQDLSLCPTLASISLATADSGLNQDRSQTTRSPPVAMTLRQMEQQLIAGTLQRTEGNITAAAVALGIDRSTLYEKIKRYNIPRP